MGSDSSDENPQKPAKPMTEGGQHVPGENARETGENARETSPQSVFVNSEPIREEQVQNAVKFLSHSKVRGSPVIYRRSFLEKKGLTKEEIDEAFRRVPDPAPTVTATQVTNQDQDGQVKTAANLQHTVSTQAPQLVTAPTGVVSTMSALRPAQFHWSHAFFAIGFLAASGAGSVLLFKKAIVPRLKSWIRKVVLEEENDSMKKLDQKPSLAEEAAAAAKAAAAAATDVARASQEMLNSKFEERRYFESFKSLLDVQVEEMKSMNNAIKKLEVTKEAAMSSSKQTEELKSSSVNFTALSAPASAEPSAAPHPKSYMEIMAMVQRGEKPPGIKEINDLPPNPNQPPSNPRLAPRAKPWEISQNGSHQVESSSSKVQDYNFPSSQVNGENSDPWWQRKNVRITEIEQDNASTVGTYNPAGNERMNQRAAWVPPQPPPFAMAEAAAAIRQPKQVIQSEQSNGNQLNSYPSNDFDELQRITKISEAGGEVEINEVSTVPMVNEIQEAQ